MVTSLASALRLIALVFLVSVAVLAAVTWRAVQEGAAHINASNAAFDRGDLDRALLHAERAAAWYAPGAPHVSDAYARMLAIARGAERQRDFATARTAWGAVRSSLLETRHLWNVDAALLARANENLARLATLQDSVDQKARDVTEALERDHSPSQGWIFVLSAAFVLMLGGLGWFGLRGISARGQFRPQQAKWALLLFAIGVACWTLAVIQA